MRGKYARLECERRFLVIGEPPTADEIRTIEDRYLIGTRLRLRRATGIAGTVLKLGQQEDIRPGVKRVTTIYLDEAEYAALETLPAHEVTKTRLAVCRGSAVWALDTYPDGTRIAETEDEIEELPPWVGEEITGKPEWSGAGLAARTVVRRAEDER